MAPFDVAPFNVGHGEWLSPVREERRMLCPVCSHQLPLGGYRETGSNGMNHRIVACDTCGTGVTVPPPTRDPSSEELFLDRYSNSRLDRRGQWYKEARKRCEWVKKWLPIGSTILELGSATGEFLSVAMDEGYSVMGVETSDWAARQTPSGPHVFIGDLSTWREENHDRTVDAVIAFHVLEHVPDPVGLLKEICGVLCQAGVVILEVPNWESRDAQLQKERWEAASLDDHVVHFTPESLELAAAKAGLDAVRVTTETTSMYDSRRLWMRRRMKWLRDGCLRPSRDLLRMVAMSDSSSPNE